MHYYGIEGGIQGWKTDVLTPVEPEGMNAAELKRVNRRNQIAAYFSGARVETATAAPPPAMSGGAAKKKKAGGC